jgi:hypothetical protein
VRKSKAKRNARNRFCLRSRLPPTVFDWFSQPEF